MKTKSILAHRLTFLFAAVIYAAFLAPSAQAQFLWSERGPAVNLPIISAGEGGSMTLDSQDNCYVTGLFDNTNNFGGVILTNQSVGGSDIFVAEYNATGALQWAQRAGGSPNNSNDGRGIGVDTNGNVYVTGGVYGPANFGSINLPASSYVNFFLAKYSNAGAIQWVTNSTGGYGVYGTGIAVDGAGNSYAVGWNNDGATLTFGSVNLTNPATTGYSTFLVKYDNTGTAKWAQSLGGSGEVYATKVAVDAAGNVYVRGTFNPTLTIGTSNLVANPSSEMNMFIAKFNNSGGLVWVQQPTGGNVSEGGVAVDPAENVYITGWYETNLNFGSGISLTNAGALDAFLAKYNSSGIIQWARQAGGGTNGGAIVGLYEDVALDGQTNVYAAGLLNSEAAIAKYNPAGTLQWIYSASNAPANPVGSVAGCAVDSAGHCYLAGEYQGTVAFGTNVLQPQETWNFFLAEVVSPPQMAILRSGTNAILTWPTNATGYTLQSTTNLSPTVWSAVSPAPVIINGQNTVTNRISGKQMFYRLSQ